jgi:hypothetical protein
MDPFRVFVTYSHEDRDLAERVTEFLQKKGLTPIWDKNIRPGTAFAGAIKSLFAHAHIIPHVRKLSRFFKRPLNLWIRGF